MPGCPGRTFPGEGPGEGRLMSGRLPLPGLLPVPGRGVLLLPEPGRGVLLLPDPGREVPLLPLLPGFEALPFPLLLPPRPGRPEVPRWDFV